MPITVTHSPDPELLSQAGYQIGAGAQLQWAEEMAQRERMQMRALESNLITQERAHAWNQEFRQQDRQARLQMNQEDNDTVLRRQELQNQSLMDRLDQQWKFRQQLDADKHASVLERDQGKFFLGVAEQRIDDINKLLNSGYTFATPQEEAAYNNAMSQIGEMQKPRDDMTPAQQASATFQLARSLPVPRQPKIPLKQQFEEEVITVPMPDGSEGRFSRDRNGAWREVSRTDSPADKKLSELEARLSIPPRAQALSDPEYDLKLGAQLTAQLTTQKIVNEKLVKVPPTQEQLRAAKKAHYDSLSDQPTRPAAKPAPGLVDPLNLGALEGAMKPAPTERPTPASAKPPSAPKAPRVESLPADLSQAKPGGLYRGKHPRTGKPVTLRFNQATGKFDVVERKK